MNRLADNGRIQLGIAGVMLLCGSQLAAAASFQSWCTSAEPRVLQTVHLTLPAAVEDPVFRMLQPAQVTIGRVDALAILAERVGKLAPRGEAARLLAERLAAAPAGQVLTLADVERDYRAYTEPQRSIELNIAHEAAVLELVALQRGRASAEVDGRPITTAVRMAYEARDPKGKVTGVRISHGDTTLMDYCHTDLAMAEQAQAAVGRFSPQAKAGNVGLDQSAGPRLRREPAYFRRTCGDRHDGR